MAQTILLVDDEQTLREVVAAALRDEGYRVAEAADGAAALEEFRAETPDLVLLDLMLPDSSGSIRSSSTRSGVSARNSSSAAAPSAASATR